MDRDAPKTGPTDPAYLTAVDQILHAEWASAKLARLALMREWVDRMWPDGHPTRRVVQIAGTAGKGSVAAFLSAGLGAAATVGTITSPHLFDFAERIRIGGTPAAHGEIAEAWRARVLPLAVDHARREPAWPLTFHEAILLVALCLFERHGCEFAVLETGLGGRYDQVTAVGAELAILTNVGDDHAARLGATLWQRALDKAGVARPGAPLITGARGEAAEVVAAAAQREGAALRVVGDAEVETLRTVLGSRLETLPADALLGGSHQLSNAALAWAALETLVPGFDATAVLDQWAMLTTPGRLSEVAPNIFIDTAHNIDETEALAAQLERRFAGRRLVFVFGLSGARDPAAVLRPLIGIADAAVVAAPPRYRGVPAEAIAGAIHDLARELRPTPVRVARATAPGEALDLARSLAEGEDDIVVFTGSAYMIDQELNPDPRLRELNASWGWRFEPDRQR